MANQVAYGFVDLRDHFSQRVSDVGEQFVNDAVNLTLQEHNRIVEEMLGIFAETTTLPQTSFTSIAASRLQPMDEHGRPRPIKPSKYNIAFPLRMAGVGVGDSFVAAAKMTVGHVNNMVAGALLADINWMRSQLLAALFADTSYQFSDDELLEDFGELTIYGLANGDAVKYVRTGTLEMSIDNHYLAQANPISDADNPFPAIYDELSEHVENGGKVIVFVASNLKASVTGLAGFVPVIDSNIRYGSATDVLTGEIGRTVPGTPLGYVDNCFVVEWKSLPSNYLTATTTDGDPALRMRQDKETELNGLVLLEAEKAPHKERLWYRRAGFGGNNRVGALVMRIGNASYAVPSGYAQPLA